jgi:hypothetical protein
MVDGGSAPCFFAEEMYGQGHHSRDPYDLRSFRFRRNSRGDQEDNLKYSVQAVPLRYIFVASNSRGVYKRVGTLPVLRPGNVPNQSTYQRGDNGYH